MEKQKAKDIEMLYFQVKLESTYLLSASIKSDFNTVKRSSNEIRSLIKKLEKLIDKK